MSRKVLLSEIVDCLKSQGFVQSSSKQPLTFESNVKYPSRLLPEKNDYAHFVVHTRIGSIQIAAKYQQSNGTTIEKLAYTALDAANSEHEHYLVVCAGPELLKHNRAIDFLNSQKCIAPKLHALTVDDLSPYLSSYCGGKVA
ncbi:PD-(D/E)XK nuclease superfamily protein [Vibrio parahaemolyticus]|uniref:PD-(D/E)XK nuclease superfamily protein n=1 Tax=Vibrio parahaemolyticus TaxID=670 RepID=UPI002554A715|nr:PD-(D/E)XK nuclease superfamily protein [Vibrio parahaemolyticus]